MNFFLLKRTLVYHLTARHRSGHGIHSPFLYNFISGLRNNPPPSVVKEIELVRREMLKTDESLTVTDLGSGSRKMRGSIRRISDIARISSVRRHYGRVLYSLAAMAGGRPVIELGTSIGIGTLYLAKAATSSTVYTMEGCEATAAVAERNFARSGCSNTRLLTGDITELLPSLLEQTGPPGVVFVDANHTGEALLQYFEVLISAVDEESVLVLDDIHLSRGMEKAWLKILGSDRITLSVDLLQMGILFFRSGVRRQDFVVKY